MAKKKYYTTKNEMISNLQLKITELELAHKKEIKELQDAALSAEKKSASMANTLKKWSSLKFKADDVWDLCNALSANDVTIILHCFKEKIVFYYEDENGNTEIAGLDTEVDPFQTESGTVEISLAVSGNDDE